MKKIVMEGVREYCEEMDVKLGKGDNGRLVIVALNEAGYNSTEVDLLDLLEWLKVNEHLVMATQQKAGK
jgi:hypothetical protein